MRSKAAPYILLVILLIVTVLIVKFRNGGSEATGPNERAGRSGSSKGDKRNHGFDRSTSFLEYTRHARCRMECREITVAEVEDIMKNGRINYRKSNAKGHPCPTYALEGNTTDAQHVRIVFAQCNEVTKVVTCIDLDKEWQCNCPGDDKKYKNQER